MVARNALISLGLGLVVMLTALPAAGQNPSLSGLPGVWIHVEVAPTLVRDGLAHHQVKTDIESQLQEAGVRLLNEKEYRSTAGQPKLMLRVSGVKVQENWKFFTFAVNLNLVQDVYLVRTENADSQPASTWYDTVAAHGYIGDIRTRIKELVGAFIEEYRSVNP